MNLNLKIIFVILLSIIFNSCGFNYDHKTDLGIKVTWDSYIPLTKQIDPIILISLDFTNEYFETNKTSKDFLINTMLLKFQDDPITCINYESKKCYGTFNSFGNKITIQLTKENKDCLPKSGMVHEFLHYIKFYQTKTNDFKHQDIEFWKLETQIKNILIKNYCF